MAGKVGAAVAGQNVKRRNRKKTQEGKKKDMKKYKKIKMLSSLGRMGRILVNRLPVHTLSKAA